MASTTAPMPLSPRLPRLAPRRTPLGDTWRTLRRNPSALAGLGVVVLWLALGLTAPILPIDDPNDDDLSIRLQAPSRSHPLGTDDNGRDILSRVIHGARISLPAG